MEAIKKIINHSAAQIVIDLPEAYRNKKLEVIVLSLEESNAKEAEGLNVHDYSKFYGKLQWEGDAVAEQRKLRDEWD